MKLISSLILLAFFVGTTALADKVVIPWEKDMGKDYIQSFVDNHPEDTTFILEAGVYRMQSVVPKDGDIFEGEDGAVMNGAMLLLPSKWIQTKIEGVKYWYYQFDDQEPDPNGGILHGECTSCTDEFLDQNVSSNDTLLDNNAKAIDEVNRKRRELVDHELGSDNKVLASIYFKLPCIYPRNLYRTASGASDSDSKVMLRKKEGPAGLKIGEWYYDEGKRRAYISEKEKPSSDVFELGMTTFAFGYAAPTSPEKYISSSFPYYDSHEGKSFAMRNNERPDIYSPEDPYAYKPKNVTIKNIVVEKYANPPQTGAIGFHRSGLDWHVKNCEVRFNHGAGIKFRGKAIVKNNYVHHNGQSGILCGDGNTKAANGGYHDVLQTAAAETKAQVGLREYGWNGGYAGKGAIVEWNTIQYNKLPAIGIKWGWEGGGTKFSQADDLHVSHNKVQHNYGAGLWSDFSYKTTYYESNIVEDNDATGILIETSLDTIVEKNSVRRNGRNNPEQKAMLAQITISNSPNVIVKNNCIAVSGPNEFGIGVWQLDSRNVEGDSSVDVSNDKIVKNTIDVAEGFAFGTNLEKLDKHVTDKGFIMDDSKYHLANPNRAYWHFSNGNLTLSEFQEKGFEKTYSVDNSVNLERHCFSGSALVPALQLLLLE